MELARATDGHAEALSWRAAATLRALQGGKGRQVAPFALPAAANYDGSLSGDQGPVVVVRTGQAWGGEGMRFVGLWDEVGEALLGHVGVGAMTGPSEEQEEERGMDNCVAVSEQLRLRWTLDLKRGTVDLGLESTLPMGSW